MISIRIFIQFVAGFFLLMSLEATAWAQSRVCFICNVQMSDASVSGPSSIQVGEVGSWVGSARWTFDYDLLPGETLDFAATALTFEEFTPPDNLWVANITPYSKIICLPDCKGQGSIIASFSATGAFEPNPGKTTQQMYLFITATLTSNSIYNIADLPIAAPKFTITVTPVPEASSFWMSVLGLGVYLVSVTRLKLRMT